MEDILVEKLKLIGEAYATCNKVFLIGSPGNNYLSQEKNIKFRI